MIYGVSLYDCQLSISLISVKNKMNYANQRINCMTICFRDCNSWGENWISSKSGPKFMATKIHPSSTNIQHHDNSPVKSNVVHPF